MEKQKASAAYLLLALGACGAALLGSGPLPAGDAPEMKILNGFNSVEEAQKFKMGADIKVELVTEHVTEGEKAAKLTFPGGKEYAGFGIRGELLARWGDYDYLVFDVFNPNEEEAGIFIRIDDEQSTNNYSTQYGNTFKAFPGANHFEIKTHRLPNQVQPWLVRMLDPNKLKLVALWLSPTPKNDTVLYFDNFSLRNRPKADLPVGLRCFGFGPADADAWPGFAPVSPKSQYDDALGYGFADTKGLAATDDAVGEGLKIGEPLCGSGVYRSGGPLAFAVKVTPGKYQLWAAAGMTMVHPKRAYTVSCNGQPIFKCAAGDRLKDLNPFDRDYTNKSSIWETLIAGRFCDEFSAEVEIQGHKAEIALEGEYASWLSGGLRALAIYPVGDTEAQKALAEIQRRRREKFLEVRRELKPAKLPAPPEFTAEEQACGFMLAYRNFGETITPYFVPQAADRLAKLAIAATPGEKEPAVFIVFPIRDAPKAEVVVSALSGPGGTIPTAAVAVNYVHYRYLKTTGGTKVEPVQVVPRNWLALEKGVSRQFWLTVSVPAGAAPGKYAGTVTVTGAGKPAAFPLEVEVYPFKLDSAAGCGLIYAHIFFVPDVPEDIEAGVRALAEYGCNSATLSGVLKLEGKDPASGKLRLNFDKLDRTMEIMKKAGMTGPVPLFDMSIQGEANGGSYAHLPFGREPFKYKLTDQAFFDAMTELTRQVDARAKEKNYLPVLMYPVTELSNDEKMGPPYLERLAAAFRKAGDVKLICSLNAPQDIVCARLLDHMMVNWGLKLTEERLAQIRNDGAKLWFQNIGQSRYTEGFLMIKTGAIGRRQWAVGNCSAGSDLQGGDPYDASANLLFRTADGAIPNVTFLRMAAGMNDYRYAVKLCTLIKEAKEKGSDQAKAAADEAQKALDAILAQIRVNTGGARIEGDGRCDSIGDFADKAIYDQFRKTIAGHILALVARK
ncbi:MAG: hypothetical protein ABSE73_17200 [Planctomycetota bacterium]